MINHINKKLRLSPRRIRNFYSNLIAGIITGGMIGAFLTIVQKYSNVTWIFPSIIQIFIFLVMFLLLLYLGKKSIVRLTSNSKEIEGYNSNIQAGLFASLFVTVLLSFQQVWVRLCLILPLTMIFVIILYYIAGRKK